MSNPINDPLLLGQRVVAILETGLRTATYKLATLMALIDHCVEHLPDNASDTLAVPIPGLAHRVLETYWRQVRPFEGQELRQSTQPRARILSAASTFRNPARGSVALARYLRLELSIEFLGATNLCLKRLPPSWNGRLNMTAS